MKQRIRLASFALGIFLLSACSSGKPTAASGTITSAAATSFVSGNSGQVLGATNAMDPNNGYSGFTGGVRRGLDRTLRSILNLSPEEVRSNSIDTSQCTTKSGTATDADSDGIPVDQTATFACDLASIITVSGSIGVKDANDALAFPKAGLTATLDLTTASKARAAYSSKFKGTFGIGVSSKTVTATTEMEGSTTLGSDSAESGVWLTTVATADSETDLKASGTATVSGFVKLKGTIGSTSTDYVLALTSSNLTYDSSCSGDSNFKTGTITAAAGTGSITATFTNCAVAWDTSKAVR